MNCSVFWKGRILVDFVFFASFPECLGYVHSLGGLVGAEDRVKKREGARDTSDGVHEVVDYV